MEVFVVLTHYMGGTQESGTFKSHENAEAHITQNQIEGKPEIMKTTVLGKITTEGTVFVASWYDRILDIHNFQAVYGNYEQAKAAVGDHGSVLSRKL